MDELSFENESGMDQHVVKHDQMIGNVVQIGKIVKAGDKDPKPPKTLATVLVHIGGEEEGTFTRNWMPWTLSRAGYDAEWSMPEINEQVVVVAPSGNLALGIIIGTVYRGDWLSIKSSDDPESKPEKGETVPSAAKQHLHQRIYQDGSEISFDKKEHLFSLLLKEKPDAAKPATMMTILAKEKKGEISIKCGEEEKEQTIIDLKSGTAEIQTTAELKCTVGDNIIEMNKEKTELTLTSGENIIALNKDKKEMTLSSGDYAISVSKNDNTIKLSIGDSMIEMKKDKIVLKSKTIELDGGTKLVVNSSGAEVS